MTLKRELESATSPVRAALDALIPDLTAAAKGAWKAQMARSTAVVNRDLPASMLGHAVSEHIAWHYAGLEGHLPGEQLLRYAGANPAVVDALLKVTHDICHSVDPQREARISCVVGLADNAYRTMRLSDPWFAPLLSAADLEDVIAEVPQAWVDDVITTTAAALDAMAPLAGKTPALRGPTFTGSWSVGGADGDLILGNTLIEVKTVQASALRKIDLQQLVSYALLDWDDNYGLDELALVTSRHGVMVRWPLDDLIGRASQGKHTLASARTKLQAALDR